MALFFRRDIRFHFAGIAVVFHFARQRPEIKVGVMGYPEFATAKRGRENQEKSLTPMAEIIRKAIAQAEKTRKAGKRIEVKSPSLGNNEYSRKKK